MKDEGEKTLVLQDIRPCMTLCTVKRTKFIAVPTQ